MAKAKTPKAAAPRSDDGKPSLWRALTPKVLLDSTPAEWLLDREAETRHIICLLVLAAAVFVPYLGAVGFWDPWEPHYGEVARQMIVHQDYVHPYWECAYFFSKPPLPMWLMTIGMHLAGTNDPARGVSVSTEWWVRSMFALMAMVGVVFGYLGVARTISRRAGVWTGVVLITSPLYFFLARQAMVDMPFEALNIAAIACLMIAVFEKEYVQDGWLYGFYALAGVATLAKGLLGIALPGAAMLVYLLVSGDWKLLARLRLITGPLVTLAVMAPWYGTMWAFDGKDDESKTWFQRFIIHDHFKRLGYDPIQHEFIQGVHTTTPVTTWTYYTTELGFGMFPWVALLPGMLADIFRRAPEDKATRKGKAKVFVISWFMSSFAFFSFAATKYHHYAFSILPPLAILLAIYLAHLLEHGIDGQGLALLMGGVLFGMVAQNLTMEPERLVNLFIYRYDRTYPITQLTPVLAHFPSHAQLGQMVQWVSDLLFANVRRTFSTIFTVGAVAALVGILAKSRKAPKNDPADRLWYSGSLAVVAVVFAIYTSAYHWRKVTPHWTQRDLFWTYTHESLPTEPIGAYLMNWRGETFYSRNTVRQLKSLEDLREFVAMPGREWVLLEWERPEHKDHIGWVRQMLGPKYHLQVIDRSNDKYALVAIDHDPS